MFKINNSLKVFISCYLLLLRVNAGWCQKELVQSIVKISQGDKHLCTGTLVRNNFVVTAAHCFSNGEATPNVSVLAGISTQGSGGIKSAVSHIFIANNYDAQTRSGMDVAVLKLETDVTGPNVRSTDLCNVRWLPAVNTVYAYAWNRATLAITPLSLLEQFSSKPRSPATTTCTAATLGNKGALVADSGGPIEVQGQFCGIISSGPGFVSRLASLNFVNLAVEDVHNFITTQLAK